MHGQRQQLCHSCKFLFFSIIHDVMIYRICRIFSNSHRFFKYRVTLLSCGHVPRAQTRSGSSRTTRSRWHLTQAANGTRSVWTPRPVMQSRSGSCSTLVMPARRARSGRSHPQATSGILPQTTVSILMVRSPRMAPSCWCTPAAMAAPRPTRSGPFLVVPVEPGRKVKVWRCRHKLITLFDKRDKILFLMIIIILARQIGSSEKRVNMSFTLI